MIVHALINVSPVVALVLAQAEGAPLANYGLLGVIVGWFMFRAEKWFSRIEHKMVGLNKTMLIEIMSRQNTSPFARRMCREELRKIDPAVADELDT